MVAQLVFTSCPYFWYNRSSLFTAPTTDSLSLESFHNVQYHIFVQNNKSSTLCLFLPHCHNSRSPKSHIKCSNAHTSIFNFHTPHPWPWTRHYWNDIVEIDDPVIPTSRISRCLQISTNCIILSDYLGLSPELWYLHHLSLDFWDCLESKLLSVVNSGFIYLSYLIFVHFGTLARPVKSTPKMRKSATK